MKYKFKEAGFDKKTGLSYAIIQTPFGNFKGTAKLHPKEKNPSTFIGCEYAEKRAIIKGLKEEKKLLCAQLKVMKEYYHLISNMTDTNPKGTEIGKAKRYIYEISKKIDLCKKNIIEIEKSIHQTDNARLKVLERIQNKFKKSKN